MIPVGPGRTRNLLLAVAVILLAGGAGFLVSRAVTRPAATLQPIATAPAPAGTAAPAPAASSSAAASPAPEATGSALAGAAAAPSTTTTPNPATESAKPRAIPDRVPPVTLVGLDGKPRSLAEFRQPILLINFWATWCTPCRREIPLLSQLRRSHRAEGVEVVGIAVDFLESVQKYSKEMQLDYPLLIGEEDGLAAAEAFGMDLVLPFTIFADADRRIVAVKVGELHADEADVILDAVRQANAKKLDLATIKLEIASKMREIAANRARAAAAQPAR